MTSNPAESGASGRSLETEDGIVRDLIKMTTPNPPRTAETVAGEPSIGACETPLVDLLRRIPRDAILQWDDGPFSSSSSPVGKHAHEAADLITSLQVQVEALSGVLGEARMVVDRIADCPPEDRARVRRVVEDARLVRHKLALPAPAKGGS